MKLIVAIFLLVVLWACQKEPTPKVEERAAFKLPTATEVFDLRSRCAKLGTQILNDDKIGPALTHEATSHYNPDTNRCYVRIDTYMRDPSRYDERRSSYLHDGQTRELLAYATVEHGKKSGISFIGGEPGWDEAIQRITAIMGDERKQ